MSYTIPASFIKKLVESINHKNSASTHQAYYNLCAYLEDMGINNDDYDLSQDASRLWADISDASDREVLSSRFTNRLSGLADKFGIDVSEESAVKVPEESTAIDFGKKTAKDSNSLLNSLCAIAKKNPRVWEELVKGFVKCLFSYTGGVVKEEPPEDPFKDDTFDLPTELSESFLKTFQPSPESSAAAPQVTPRQSSVDINTAKALGLVGSEMIACADSDDDIDGMGNLLMGD